MIFAGWKYTLGGMAVVLALGCAARAQGPVDAGLRGRVVDAKGVGVVGVTLRLVAADGGAEREIESGAGGRFFLLRLAPGAYSLRVGEGVAAISVEAGELRDVTVTMGPGAVVSLRGGSGEGLGEESLQGLPVEDRAWESLGELDSQMNGTASATRTDEDVLSGNEDASGARDASDLGSAATGLSVGGLASIENQATVDGLSLQQSFRAGPRGAAGDGPRVGSSYAEGAVRSLRLESHSFSAQYGAAGGGFHVVTRSGEGGLHGSAFVLVRESAWAAANPFSVATHYRDGVVTVVPVKPVGSDFQFGGSVSVPLGVPGGARRTAVFGSVEVQRRQGSLVSTPAGTTGGASFFSLSPTQTALLGTRGVGAAATNVALNYLDSLTGTIASDATRVLGFGRVDASVSKNDAVALSYSGHYSNAPAGAALGQASDAVVARGTGSVGASYVDVEAGAVRWLHTFSSRWNNEVRAQVAHELAYETPHAPLPQEPGIGPGGLAPEVSIAPNGFSYGTPTTLGRSAYPDELRVEAAEAMQVRVGRSLLTVGGDWSRVHDRIASLTDAEGEFLYDSGTTGGHAGGLVDWITDYTFNVTAYPNGGCPSIHAVVHDFCFRTYTQSFGPQQTEFVTQEFAGFAEAALRLRRDLTATIGARYDYELLPLPQVSNPTLDADVLALGLANGGVTATFPEDRNNVGPRVSAAWSPAGKSGTPLFTMRVGYGAFYGRVPGATVQAALTDTALPETTEQIRITPTTETQCPQVTTVGQGFGYPCAYVSAPPAAVAATTSATVFSNRFRMPAVQRASLELERSFGRLEIRAEYSMALATQLPQSVDLNLAPSTGVKSFVLQGGDGRVGVRDGETFVVPLYTGRLISQYGPVTALVSHANATYHAGTIEAQWRGRALEVRGGYTFSRAIDTGPQSGAVPRLNGQFDPFVNGYDKGLSTLNFPQRFSGALVYASGLKSGPKALRGWRIAAIGVAGSGAPYSYGIFGGTRLTGGRESINGSGGATYLPTIGRNTLRLPPRGRVDLRAGREFALGAHVRVEAFAEAFNLLNARSLSRVETRAFLVGVPATTSAPTPLVFQDAATVAAEGIGTPPFGAPTSSTTGLSRERQVEVGVRLHF